MPHICCTCKAPATIAISIQPEFWNYFCDNADCRSQKVLVEPQTYKAYSATEILSEFQPAQPGTDGIAEYRWDY